MQKYCDKSGIMETSQEFEVLVCGTTSENMFEYGSIIDNLSTKIEKVTKLIINYDWNCGKANIDIPFYCKNILESSMTALLGRIDPFRLIMVYKVQSDPAYDLGKKAQSAVEWSGDIIAKNAPTRDLWLFDKKKFSLGFIQIMSNISLIKSLCRFYGDEC